MNRLFTLLLVVAVIMISCTGSERGMFEEGMKLLEKGSIAEALEKFDAIVENYPESPYGPYGRAVYFDREKLIYEAINESYKALRNDSLFAPALLLNAELSLEIKYPDQAFYFAVLNQNSGGDSVRGVVVESDALMMAGKLDDTRLLLEKAFGQSPDEPFFHLQNAKYFVHTGDYTRALDECRLALSTDTDNPHLFKSVGDFYRELGLFDSTVVYYDRALALTGDDNYLMADIADAYTEMGYLHRANILTEEFSQIVNESHRYYLLLRDIFIRRGKIKNAMLIYGMPVQHYAKNLSYKCNLAETKARTGEGLGSGQYFMTAVQMAGVFKYPRAAGNDINRRYLKMLVEDERYNEAGPMAEGRLDSLPNDFYTISDIAFLFFNVQCEPSLKVKILKRLKQTAKGSLMYTALIGDLYARIDSLERAHDIFSEVLKTDKFNLTAILGEIDVLEKSKQYDKAIDFIDSFDEYLSYYPDVGLRKTELYRMTGDLDAALRFAERLIELGRNDINRYKTAIALALEKNDDSKVEELYHLCLENNSNNPYALALNSRYYFERGEVNRASELVSRSLALDSSHISTLVLGADLMAVRGETDSAIAQYERIVELDKYCGDAYGNMALLLVETEKNVKLGSTIVKRAIYNDGGNAKHRATLGRAYYKMGKYKSAYGTFKHALRFAPDDPEIKYYAGLNLIKNNMPKQAKILLKKAIRLGLNDDLKKQAEAELKKL
jgi:tetratricopeptide (TPR) repeat protein